MQTVADDLLHDYKRQRAGIDLAPEFNLPSGIQRQEIEDVCRDLRFLADCFKICYEDHYHNIDDVLYDAPNLDLYTEGDRIGFYSALRWVDKVLERIENDKSLRKGELRLSDVSLLDTQVGLPPNYMN